MFDNFSNFSEDKAEVYAEVVRSIYCDIGGFKKTEKTFNDMLKYLSEINGRDIINT